ncbi:glucans biosynthesis glucosyltransferase MdoH [Pacificispira sp.]|uniref:glucans biosynthesis glucosyltransferase MdoH n=1 Tax=Pacificispira sp. TaxID=2888761 RepID=UPI003BAC343B
MSSLNESESCHLIQERPQRSHWVVAGRRLVWLRRLYLSLVAVSAISGIGIVVSLLRPDSVTAYVAATALVVLFALLFTWIASNFWMTVFGLGRLISDRWAGVKTKTGVEAAGRPVIDTLGPPRTAIVMPIYNEDPARVAAGIQATLESVEEAGALGAFDFYMLSDTKDADIAIREEIAWMELISQPSFRNRVFYRRRESPTERKSGNIKEFLEKWGHRYEYMVVLDADSVMTGGSLVELVRRMDADPQCGLIQTWPQITNGRTLFSRMHQFASRTYGRILAYGMATLINPHGNYWGHNSIIRVSAFMQSCGLPHLPGPAPIGGEILSHDFVEAAFLVRRGWKVELAPDIDGSYEEMPPNIVQHVARDQRWCQGNLQHAWLLAARDIHPASRINFLTGILAYATSPIWFLFVAVAAVISFSDHALFSPATVLMRQSEAGWTVAASTVESWLVAGLLGATLIFILSPKLMGIVAGLAARREPVLRLLRNFVTEAVLSVLVAPTVMLRHSIFIARLLCGHGVNWNPQQRDESRLSWGEATKAFYAQTVLAAVIIVTGLIWPTGVHLWLSPILAGLLVSIPLAVWTGRVPGGDRETLVLDDRTGIPPVMRRTNALSESFAEKMPPGDPVGRILDDPKLASLHLFMLATEPDGDSCRSVEGGVMAKVHEGREPLSDAERASILSNSVALRRLQAERAVRSGRS